MRALLPLIAAALAGCALSFTEDDMAGAPPPAAEDTGAAAVASIDPLAVFSRLAEQAEPAENVVYSPTSVRQAFGLVHLGASGATKAEIERFFAMAPGEEGDFALAARAAELRETERGVKVRIANALFLADDWRFRPEFLDATRTIYGATTERLDFMDDPAGAARVMNAWAKDKTEGLIESVVTPQTVNRDAAIYLANATFFEGDWTMRFKGGEQRPFLFGDGSERPFHLMKNEADFASVSRGGWRAMRMTYGWEHRRFAFDVMMPEARVAVLPRLSPAQIGAMSEELGQVEPAPLRVWLPRFQADMRANLIPPLSSLGLELPFDPNRADLSAMSVPGQQPLYIEEAFQVARLQVFERGTRAAAITMAVAVPTSMPPPFEGPDFIVDRPFLFAIRDLTTGEVLFFGRISAPEPYTERERIE